MHFLTNGSGAVDTQLEYLAKNESVDGHQSFNDGLGQLTVKDNGVGLPPDLKFNETASMGLHLVNVLVEQLQGELGIAAAPGTSVTVKFPLSGTLSGFSEHGSNSYS